MNILIPFLISIPGTIVCVSYSNESHMQDTGILRCIKPLSTAMVYGTEELQGKEVVK